MNESKTSEPKDGREAELTTEQLEQVSGGKIPQMDPQIPPGRWHSDPREPPNRQ